MKQAQAQGLAGPEAQQQMQQLNIQMEARKAVLIADIPKSL